MTSESPAKIFEFPSDEGDNAYDGSDPCFDNDLDSLYEIILSPVQSEINDNESPILKDPQNWCKKCYNEFSSQQMLRKHQINCEKNICSEPLDSNHSHKIEVKRHSSLLEAQKHKDELKFKGLFKNTKTTETYYCPNHKNPNIKCKARCLIKEQKSGHYILNACLAHNQGCISAPEKTFSMKDSTFKCKLCQEPFSSRKTVLNHLKNKVCTSHNRRKCLKNPGHYWFEKKFESKDKFEEYFKDKEYDSLFVESQASPEKLIIYNCRLQPQGKDTSVLNTCKIGCSAKLTFCLETLTLKGCKVHDHEVEPNQMRLSKKWKDYLINSLKSGLEVCQIMQNYKEKIVKDIRGNNEIPMHKFVTYNDVYNLSLKHNNSPVDYTKSELSNVLDLCELDELRGINFYKVSSN